MTLLILHVFCAHQHKPAFGLSKKTKKTPSYGLKLLQSLCAKCCDNVLKKRALYAIPHPFSHPLTWFKPSEGKTSGSLSLKTIYTI